MADHFQNRLFTPGKSCRNLFDLDGNAVYGAAADTEKAAPDKQTARQFFRSGKRHEQNAAAKHLNAHEDGHGCQGETKQKFFQTVIQPVQPFFIDQLFFSEDDEYDEYGRK